jgi:hypothetical protein
VSDVEPKSAKEAEEGGKKPLDERGGREGAVAPRRPGGGLAGQLRRLERDLTEVARSAYRRTFGSGGSFPDGGVPLELRFELDLESGALQGVGEPIPEQISAGLRRALAPADLFRPGRVHCHRCGSAECEHAVPPRPQAVFAGYGPTGQPEWVDFAQLLVERKDPRIEAFYDDPPAIVPLVVMGRDLKKRLLRPFGRASKGWDPLAQLVVGGLRDRGRSLTGREQLFAVSCQAVETRSGDGTRRLVLNLVGTTPDGKEAESWFAERSERWISLEVARARRRLAAIEREVVEGARRPGGGSPLAAVPAVLHELARALEQGERQSGRRTVHSEHRRLESRPTPAALGDAWSAPDERFLVDERRETVVVLGPKGRAHVFAPDGRHVTSLRIGGDQLERRIGRERWRPARPDEIRAFRERLPKRPEGREAEGSPVEGK